MVVAVLLVVYLGVVAFVAVPLVTGGSAHKGTGAIAPISRDPLTSVPLLPAAPPPAGQVLGDGLILGDVASGPAPAAGVTTDAQLGDLSLLGQSLAGSGLRG